MIYIIYNIFHFNYLINRIQKKELAKITAKNKKNMTIVKDWYFRFQTWLCQSFEVLLAWFKFQAKIPGRSGVCVQGEWQKYNPPSPPLSKNKGVRDIGHSMSIRNLILGANSVTGSYLLHYNSLSQNATDIITKWDSYFITKCDRSLLQNASGF